MSTPNINNWQNVPIGGFSTVNNVCWSKIDNDLIGKVYLYQTGQDTYNTYFSFCTGGACHYDTNNGDIAMTNLMTDYVFTENFYNNEFSFGGLIGGTIEEGTESVLQCTDPGAIIAYKNFWGKSPPLTPDDENLSRPFIWRTIARHISNEADPLKCCFKDAVSQPSLNSQTVDNSSCSSCGYPNSESREEFFANINKALTDGTFVNDEFVLLATQTATGNFGYRNIASAETTLASDNSITKSTSSNDTTEGCRKYITNYCINGVEYPPGTDDGLTPFERVKSRWAGNDQFSVNNNSGCYYAFERIMAATDDFPASIDPTGQLLNRDAVQWGNTAMSYLFDLAKNNGVDISATPDLPGYDPFSNTLFQLCSVYPAACQNALNNLCNGYDTNSLGENQDLIKWCGCYLNEDSYDVYTKNYGINKECTPMCNRTGNIKSISSNSSLPVNCSAENICVIDNTNLIYTSGINSGDISLRQICGSCGDNNVQCKCIVNDNTIVSDIQNSDISISQVCGDITYYKTTYDANGNPVVTREDGIPSSVQNDAELSTINIGLIFLGIILFLILIALIGYYF